MTSALRDDKAPAAARSEPDYPTADADVQPPDRPRYRLYKLCPCKTCDGTGKDYAGIDPLHPRGGVERCGECRGEGKTLTSVAEAHDLRGIGAAFATLADEGELIDCPIGLLDSQGDTGRKWLVSPWLASPRNVSDAGRVLRSAQKKGEK